MGEFTQNLLKLTEFPFSYSLMGLLTLIFGQGINLEELSFAKIGPLLILMGFVATTLSICDPVGAIQRIVIKGRRLTRWEITSASDLVSAHIFGHPIGIELPLPYAFAIEYSPEDIKKRYSIDWNSLNRDWNKINSFISEWKLVKFKIFRNREYNNKVKKEIGRTKNFVDNYLNSIEKADIKQIAKLLEGLKQQTVRTKWITAEVDRITALIYFIVTISVFIVAIVLLPDLLHKFSQVFQDTKQIRIGILIFSILALGAVTYMFVVKVRGLLNKASIVFKFLTALGAIKTEKERFKPILQDIEKYLDNNDWILSEYWVGRIQEEYTEVFLDKVTSHTRTRKERTV